MRQGAVSHRGPHASTGRLVLAGGTAAQTLVPADRSEGYDLAVKRRFRLLALRRWL